MPAGLRRSTFRSTVRCVRATLATTSGLVAYSGIRVGNDQTAEFTPVSSYPGLTAEVRARLGEIKVAPVSAEVNADTPAQLRDDPPTTASIPGRRLRRRPSALSCSSLKAHLA